MDEDCDLNSVIADLKAHAAEEVAVAAVDCCSVAAAAVDCCSVAAAVDCCSVAAAAAVTGIFSSTCEGSFFQKNKFMRMK